MMVCEICSLFSPRSYMTSSPGTLKFVARLSEYRHQFPGPLKSYAIPGCAVLMAGNTGTICARASIGTPPSSHCCASSFHCQIVPSWNRGLFPFTSSRPFAGKFKQYFEVQHRHGRLDARRDQFELLTFHDSTYLHFFLRLPCLVVKIDAPVYFHAVPDTCFDPCLFCFPVV